MNIVIANKNFEQLGLLENAEVIWTTRYYKSGDFELYVSRNDYNLNLVLNGYYVIRTDENEDNIGVIEDITITNTPLQGDMIKVIGKLAQGFFLNSRVISQQTQLYGNVQNAIRNLLVTNIINPVDTNRKIDFIELGEIDDSITENIEMQTTGDNLLTKIEEICEEKKIGFRMTLKDNRLIFKLYKGINRSYSQIDNPYVVFSDKYDNLSESSYIRTISNVKNFAYVAGEGEGLDRRIVEAYSNTIPTGQDRFEVWVDQRNISSNDEEITEAELTNQMFEEGLENLVGISEAIDGSIMLRGYTYKKEFSLGDIVELEQSQWGLGVSMRVIECIESVNNTGKTVVLTFGN